MTDKMDEAETTSGGWNALGRLRAVVGLGPLRITLVLMVSVTTFMFGSADPLPQHLNAMVILAFSVLVLALAPVRPGLRRLARVAAWLIVILAGLVAIQTVHGVPEMMAHPNWAILNEALGTSLGAISTEPAKTLSSLPALILPFAVFIATLALCDTDAAGVQILKILSFIGGALAMLAIFQFSLFPGTLLVIPKEAYLDSLTAPFVNRNTAATYYGTIALVHFGFLASAMRQDARTLALSGSGVFEPRIVHGGLMTMALVALALTNSRAGLAATVLAFGVVVPLLVTFGGSRSARRGFGGRRGAPLGRRLALGLASAFAVVMVALVIGGRSIMRLDVQGLEDGRFCILPRTFDLARDNWLFGTGLGTFETAYLSYRDPACGIYGAWDSAHNVFLDGFVTLGIAVIPITLIVLLALFATFVIGVRRRRSMRMFPFVGIGLLVLATAHSVFDFSLEIPGFAAPFAMIVAAYSSLSMRPANIPADQD